MAKRELIDKKKLIRKMNQSNGFDISERMKFSNLIECQRFITEQEIVKPYLEKLKEQIVGKSFTEEFFDEDAFNSMYSESVSKDTAECESYIEMTIIKMDDVLRLIDNLLSESEEE